MRKPSKQLCPELHWSGPCSNLEFSWRGKACQFLAPTILWCFLRFPLRMDTDHYFWSSGPRTPESLCSLFPSVIIGWGRLTEYKYLYVIHQPTVTSVSDFPIFFFQEKVICIYWSSFYFIFTAFSDFVRCLCVGLADRIWGWARVPWGPWASAPGVLREDVLWGYIQEALDLGSFMCRGLINVGVGRCSEQQKRSQRENSGFSPMPRTRENRVC